MSFHTCFYRSLAYLHVFITISESVLTLALFILILSTERELFFKSKDPDEDLLELIGFTNLIIIIVLFFAGAIRTVILFIFLFAVLLLPGSCVCLLCIPSFRNVLFKLFKAKSTNRFLSFNCNCPCYRARPKLRFQLQFAFVIFISCIRITMIAFCLIVPHSITTKSLAVIVAISFFFLILTSLLDYYHYRVWWHYKPNFRRLAEDFKMPTTPLSTKHKRYIPYHLLGDNRTKRLGDKACSDDAQCQNRSLEHIFIFHFRGFNPQPRYCDIQQTTSGKNRYIGFHQTDLNSAIMIAHSDFMVSTKYDSTMIGHGVYFARSREGTERKANRHGAFICAEIDMGRVLELGPKDRNLYRGKNDWWDTYDTAYFCNTEPSLDEFCVQSPTQILNWIIVIEKEFDTKVVTYGLDGEFHDTRCFCI